MEADYRRQLRDLERKLEQTRIESARRLEAFQVKTLAPLNAIADSTKRTLSKVETIDDRTRQTAARLETVAREVAPGPLRRLVRRAGGKAKRGGRRALREGRRDAGSVARRAATRLPDRAQLQLRRARRVARAGVAQPTATTKLVGRRLAPRATSTARAGAHKLPPPAQRALKTTWVRLRLVREAPIPTAKRGASPAAAGARPRPARVATPRRPGSVRPHPGGATTEEKPKPAPTPKGPALRQWKDAYVRMVAATLPDGAPVAGRRTGEPDRGARPPPAPRDRVPREPQGQRAGQRPRAHRAPRGAALRGPAVPRAPGGVASVVPPAGRAARPRRRDLPDAGRRRRGPGRSSTSASPRSSGCARCGARSCGSRVARSTARRCSTGPTAGSPRSCPGLTTFRPPAGDRLPYLDHSVDVVVVDGKHDPGEAGRVARLGVITISDDGSLALREMDLAGTGAATHGSGSAAGRRLVRRARVRRPLGGCARRARGGGRRRRCASARSTRPRSRCSPSTTSRSSWSRRCSRCPGRSRPRSRSSLARPDSVVAGKVLRADGRLDSAGGTVFFDRSVALIATGAEDPSAPVARLPACSVLGARAGRGRRCPAGRRRPDRTMRSTGRSSGSGARPCGRAVVRSSTSRPSWRCGSTGDGGEASAPLPASSWQRVLDLRPQRPAHLGDGEWRYLLAHDDVEACRR